MSGLDDQAAPGGARQDAAPGGELLQSTPSVTDALDALELEKPLSKSRLKDVCDRFGIDQSRAQDKKGTLHTYIHTFTHREVQGRNFCGSDADH